MTNILAPDGSLTKEYTYDSFGVAASSGSFSNEVQFTGAIADGGGVYYMNARYYNANTGRFLTQDSYKGNAYEPWTQHLYTYVGNNPVNLVDPTGHRATEFSNMEEEGGIRRESVVPKYLAPVFDGVDEDLARHAYIELAINGGYFTSDIEKQLPGDVASIDELAYKVHTRLGMSLYQAEQYHQQQLEAQRQALLYLLAFSASMKSIENYNAAGGPFSNTPAGSAFADISKFTNYIFKPGANHGKDIIFRNLGYSSRNSTRLVNIFEKQAAAKFGSNNYTMGKLDQWGQRINIEIELSGIGSATGKTSYLNSAWNIKPDGSIALVTPFSGFTR